MGRNAPQHIPYLGVINQKAFEKGFVLKTELLWESEVKEQLHFIVFGVPL